MVDQQRRAMILLGFFILLFGSTLGILITERNALLELRSSLGLRSKDWPIKGDPCLNWIGVKCDSEGRVIGINISGFRRTRIGKQNPQFAIDSVANLTMLTDFNASRFALPGLIPEWLGQKMLNLQVLDLRSCGVNGSIPSSLGNLTSVTSLYLSDNSLTGVIPSSLGQLLPLSVFDVSHNSLTGSIPVSFSSLGNLSVFEISSNLLSGSIPTVIGKLSKLQLLNLSNNRFSSSIPAQLGELASLINLDLSNNFLTGNLPDIFWSMSALRLLDVSGNNFTGSLPNINTNLTANTTDALFNLSGNMFYGNLTSILRNFRFVDLSDNYFEGKVPDYATSNVSLNVNCLQNVSNQRTLLQCQSFYAERGLVFDNFGNPNGTQTPPSKNKSGKRHKNLIIILSAVFGGLGVIIILLIVLMLICGRRRNGATQRGTGAESVPTGNNPPPPGGSVNLMSLGEVLTYQQLLQATNEFSDGNLIKHGHSGDLFRGVLEGGIHVVIKKVNVHLLTNEGYSTELDLFNKISHVRLVPFLGHCLEKENEKLLVYKFMPNEDLSNALFKKTNSEDDSLQSLDWITRLKIAIGTAEGLAYLHHDCTPPLVHSDVQASSILLDDKFEVRLGSLSEVCAQQEGSHQRRIKRILSLRMSDQGPSGSGTAACAYDVYCFGKVLLELVTGKLGISASNEATLKNYLEEILPYISIYDKELVIKIIDPSLIVDEDLLEEVWAIAIVARSCLNPKPSRRPLMRYILKALENPFKVVREEHSGSARLKATSSRSSWNAAALFGSWRHGSLDVVGAVPASSVKGEGGGSLKRSGTTGSQSQGSGPQIGGEHSSSSRRRHLKEIYPEPEPSDAQYV